MPSDHTPAPNHPHATPRPHAPRTRAALLASLPLSACLPLCACLALSAGLAAPRSAEAQQDPASPSTTGTVDPRLDPSTGRQVVTRRADRPFDILHTRLELDFPDVNTPSLIGLVSHTLRPVAFPQSRILLNCKGPQPTRAFVNGVETGFTLRNDLLEVTLPTTLAPGQSAIVQVAYTLDFAANRGEGLTFSPPRDNPQGPSAARPVIHAQGQAEVSQLYVPLFDSPQERITSEVIVTVDSTLEVLSNGVLVERVSASPQPDGTPRDRWHWSLDREHAPYLKTLLIGEYSIIELGGTDTARPGLPMPAYVPVGYEDTARALWARTPDMVAFFEQLLDEPFPWPQYAQAAVRGFVWGGMENTGATFLNTRALRGEPGDQDPLIAHELAHQWFGNLITCRHWDHTWIQEGFATYSEALWAQHVDGPDAFRANLEGWLRGQIVFNQGVAPQGRPMVSQRYAHPDQLFFQPDDPYAKGAYVYHMLRVEVGEEAFVKGLRALLDDFRNQPVETDQVRRTFERISGKGLERFFRQWTQQPGIPRLRMGATSQGTALEVTIDQTQTIDRFNPAFALSLPVEVVSSSGERRMLTLQFDARTSTHRIPITDADVRVDFDPRLSVLASIRPRALDLPSLAGIPTELENPPTPQEQRQLDAMNADAPPAVPTADDDANTADTKTPTQSPATP